MTDDRHTAQSDRQPEQPKSVFQPGRAEIAREMEWRLHWNRNDAKMLRP